MRIIEAIRLSLEEDIRNCDVTTSYLEMKNNIKTAKIVIKEEGILAGIDIAKMTFKEIDKSLKFEILKENGSIVKPKDIVATITGEAASILKAERVALNFLQRMSGISTLTNNFVKEISHTSAKLLDTRKTTPLLREFEKNAVKIGGGFNHRFGLYDMILIKENHIDSIGNITDTIKKIKENNVSYKIEIEVKDLTELEEAFNAGVDRIMLDNMSLEDMKKAVNKYSGKVLLEASGNVKLNTVKKIAETGVDYISCGSLTHSYTSLDISLLLL